MKILVTGGTGVIGAAAIPALLRAGHEVRLLSRHAGRDAEAFPRGVEAFDADITQSAGLAEAADGCGAVLHIAGIVEEQPPEVTFEKINVEGTRHLLAAATETGGPTFVYVSSLGAERGRSEYHQSKRRAEDLVRTYAGRWLILRPGNVYGPGDETISLLLKMARTLPAVPMVEHGDQPFQPIWYADLGQVFARAVEDRRFNRRTLELAGDEITTTEDVLNRFAVVTGCNPPRLEVPAWLTQVGTKALEAFDAAGKKMLERAGLGAPINSSKLQMLLEWSVIPEGRPNALVTEFGVEPTPLQDGLELLADRLVEQLPGEGVGALKQATYWADLHGMRLSAADVIETVCQRIADVMPIEFAAEPGAPAKAEDGATMSLELKGRGKVQVRVEERTATRATFVTLEGHPLAGVMQLYAEDLPGGVRFGVRTASQPANIFDWLAMNTIGGTMQNANWRALVRRVAKLCGGEMPDGVQQRTHTLGGEETRDLERWVQRIVQRQQRAQRTEEAKGGAPTGQRQSS